MLTGNTVLLPQTNVHTRKRTKTSNDELNVNFTAKEIADVIKKLKNNKACGDMIRNEFIKNCSKDAIEVITNLFDLILDSGVIPTNWCLGIIMRIIQTKKYIML